MFGSTILDVLIGLFLLYVVLSMMASAINEYMSNLLDKRAQDLEKYLLTLFNSGSESNDQLQQFHNSIFVNAKSKGVDGKKNLPAYITKADFAQAVFDIAEWTVTADKKIDELKLLAKKLPDNSPLKRVFLNAVERTDQSRIQMITYLENWFDGQMEQLRNAYKKWTNYQLVFIGLVIALVLNVDTIRITDALLTNPTLRETIVEQAKQFTTQTEAEKDKNFSALQAQLNDLALPIGWPDTTSPTVQPGGEGGFQYFLWFIKKLIGILVTGFAVSQGSPFWFDLLNKITNVRAANRPPDEKPDK